MLRVLEVTFPVFALVFCGFLGQRHHLLPEKAVDGLNAFVFFFALPAMLFRIVAAQSPASLSDARFALGYAATGMAVFAFTRWAALPGRGTPAPRASVERSQASAFALSATHGNVGYLGVPLVLELGDRFMPPLILVVVCDIFIAITLAIVLLELEQRRRQGRSAGAALLPTVLRSFAGSPLVLAIAAGLALTTTGTRLPAVMENFVRILSSAAGPCALFAIGASLGDRRIVLSGAVRSLVAIKLVAHPALAAIVLFGIVRAEPLAASVGVLAASLPAASSSFIIARRYDVDGREIGSAILAGTFAALVTVSTVIWVLGMKRG